ncbi:hypothetical protein [Enterococcus phage MDA2]|uniref:Uncharacterized protein n=2 Tax=Kochikohdavirus TaxID=2560160 RepID=A0AAE7RFY6_9CAUD|nr:hypothetical protein [Enterococcus phage MDA2]
MIHSGYPTYEYIISCYSDCVNNFFTFFFIIV